MTIRPEAEINRLLASTAAEYVDEERAAAEEESQTTTSAIVGESHLARRPCQGAD